MLTVVPTYALILDYPVLANPTPHASTARPYVRSIAATVGHH